jgi:hypothetical protein
VPLQAKEFQIRHLHGKLIAREIGALVRQDRSAEAAAAEEKMVTLAVEGNISAGKSTFLDVLSHEETNLRDMLQAGYGGNGAGIPLEWHTAWGRAAEAAAKCLCRRRCLGHRLRFGTPRGVPAGLSRCPPPRLPPLLQVVPEPVAQWQEYRCRDAEGVEKPVNVLQKFYSNPQRFAYSFQHYVLMSRMQAVRARGRAVQLPGPAELARGPASGAAERSTTLRLAQGGASTLPRRPSTASFRPASCRTASPATVTRRCALWSAPSSQTARWGPAVQPPGPPVHAATPCAELHVLRPAPASLPSLAPLL